ncbi:MAG: hypothetical protein R3230_06605, partial [Nitrosopumilaceae archaeon]|nr:hypothetical protein [Nitrosopumilaceae archaeon]
TNALRVFVLKYRYSVNDFILKIIFLSHKNSRQAQNSRSISSIIGIRSSTPAKIQCIGFLIESFKKLDKWHKEYLEKW